MRCFWCHNPETLASRPELQLFLERCIACGECFHRCPHGAHALVDGQREFRRELCTGCGQCAETCYARALVLVGETKTVEEVMEEVLQDSPYYETSGGGVTLSGGEPLLQPGFSYAILERCKQEGIHTGIETAASVRWEVVASILPVTDIVMLDIKMMDSRKHQECTGIPNEHILANAVHLGQQRQPLIVRTPIVPGINDTPEDVAAIAEFVAELPNLWYYELLPFHSMATSKYDSLGMAYHAREKKAPSEAQMDALTAAARHFVADARHG